MCLMGGHHFQVVDLACGYGFTVFAVNDKSGPSCYGTGINTDSQLGKYDRKHSAIAVFSV